ncbi:MAG: nuclear transport factor 2 family protein [Nitrososphaerales archaeon]
MRASLKIKAEVNSMLKQFSNAASQRDAEGMLALFAPDPDIVMLGSEGESAMNRGEFARFLKRVFSRPMTYSWKWKRKVISTRGQVAWVTAQGFVITRRNGRSSSRQYRLTAVFERRKGKWFWMHYHGSEPV